MHVIMPVTAYIKHSYSYSLIHWFGFFHCRRQ